MYPVNYFVIQDLCDLFQFYNRMKWIWKLKKRIMRCLIWSVPLYAAETWTLVKADVRWLETFEMWICQIMDRIN